MNEIIHVIGGGLAGSEAALQLANLGYKVKLFEMRDHVQTPAHHGDSLAQLVCSNSFKGLGLRSAHGVFKRELIKLGSHLMDVAMETRVPAGESLTVDRKLFSEHVEKMIQDHPNIELVREEVTAIDDDQWTIIAAGPLCSSALSDAIFKRLGSTKLNFFDAIAPVIDADSIDMDIAFVKNRWEKGETPDFINCPLDKETYDAFVNALVEAESVEPKPFEDLQLFEGCLPVEELAKRGHETLRFGPMRPIGLRIEETGEKFHAVLQLRAENKEKTLYNMVGFQTRLKWGTQKRIFRMIPSLKTAEFERLGAMHRNTFIDSPSTLNNYLNLDNTKIYFAGQITGAEGYTEAIGTGLFVALQLDSMIKSGQHLDFPKGSCLEALTRHITTENNPGATINKKAPHFQPMNFNFGLLPRDERLPKKQKKDILAQQANEVMDQWISVRNS